MDRGVERGGGGPHAEQVEAGRHAAGDRHVADRDEAVGRVVLDHDPAQHDLIANTVLNIVFCFVTVILYSTHQKCADGLHQPDDHVVGECDHVPLPPS